MKRLVVLLATLVSLSGCASVYTAIYKPDPSTNVYYVTRQKQGFFSVSSTLFRCQTMPNSDLHCVEVDTP